MSSQESEHWQVMQEAVERELPFVRHEISTRRDLFKTAFAGLEFRMPLCGLSCFELEKLLRKQGIETQQLKNATIDEQLNNKLGWKHFMTGGHVILRVTDKDETYIADPTYSQFLRPFGLDPMLLDIDTSAGNSYFPEEEVIVFPHKEIDHVSDWLSTTVERFWMLNAGDKRYLRYLQSPYKQHSITQMSHADLTDYFMSIYDLSAYDHYVPTL